MAGGIGVTRLIAVALLAAMALTACGKKGPPSPPGPPDQVIYPRNYPKE